MSWETLIIPILEAVVIVILYMAKRKLGKYFDGAVDICRVAYANMEENESGDLKTYIKNTVELLSPTAKEVDKIIVETVDVKKATQAAPLKRFWRRTLQGKNLFGAVARLAGNVAIKQHINNR